MGYPAMFFLVFIGKMMEIHVNICGIVSFRQTHFARQNSIYRRCLDKQQPHNDLSVRFCREDHPGHDYSYSCPESMHCLPTKITCSSMWSHYTIPKLYHPIGGGIGG